MTSARTYDQYCAIARGLDVVGDRWTLLIVRELLTGPKRYSELLEGLPGIATNLLVERLRALESAGVVERMPGPGAARVRPYHLTGWGRELEPVLLALARWARPLLGTPRPGDAYRLRWLLLTLQARFDPAAAGDLTRTYEFRIGTEIVHARVAHGAVQAGDGAADAPDVVISGPQRTFLAWGTGQLTAAEAVSKGIDVLGRDGAAHSDPAGALDDLRVVFGSDG